MTKPAAAEVLIIRRIEQLTATIEGHDTKGDEARQQRADEFRVGLDAGISKAKLARASKMTSAGVIKALNKPT